MRKPSLPPLAVLLVAIGISVFTVLSVGDNQTATESGKNETPKQSTPDEKKAPVTQDPEILATIQSIGAVDYKDLDMLSDGAFPTACPDADGCYFYEIIFTTPEKKTDRTVVAHEYLHYVWEKFDLANDPRLISDLTDFKNNNQQMHTTIQNYEPYRGASELNQLGEAFAFGCSEYGDPHLTSYIVDQCNKYIDRSTLTMLQ